MSDKKEMSKSELVRSVAKRAGVSQEVTNRVLTALLHGRKGVLALRLRAGYEVVLPGFGRFKTRDSSWKWARNPATGATIRVPPRRRPILSFSEVLKTRVNEGVTETPDPEARIVKPKAPVKAGQGKVTRAPVKVEPLEDELTPDPSDIDEPTPTEEEDEMDPDDFEDGQEE